MKHNILNVIPDVRHVIPHLTRNLLPLLAAAAILGACTEDYIAQQVGTLPDEGPMLATSGRLVSTKSLTGKRSIRLYEGDEPAVEQLVYRLTKPASKDITVKVVPSEELAQAYIDSHPVTDPADLDDGSVTKIMFDTKQEIFPTNNLTFTDDGKIIIPSGQFASNELKIALSDKGLESGTYILALTVDENDSEILNSDKCEVVYYRISFREKADQTFDYYNQYVPIPELCPDLISVFYVNTQRYQPLIAAAYGVYAESFIDIPSAYYSLGHIVNLKKATLEYDNVSKRCVFDVGEDLHYVLEHNDKYIKPLTSVCDRKICICIENGGKGVGFCNMTDGQISDFVMQVKTVIEKYGLDGVNLWDEDSKYPGGVPDNTTSYPKLIKALREAMPDKMITLVDKGEATEYFYDESLCGGISVGNFIDYAWHGYVSGQEPCHVIIPGQSGKYNTFNRKGICGLDEKFYGNVNVPFYPKSNFQHIEEWLFDVRELKDTGFRKNNILVMGDDLIGQHGGEEEGSVRATLDEINYWMPLGDHANGDLGDIWYQSWNLISSVSFKVDDMTNGLIKEW